VNFLNQFSFSSSRQPILWGKWKNASVNYEG
jgi:hypothetical protein